MVISTKLNESFYQISGTAAELSPIKQLLRLDVPGARFDPMIKRGLKPDHVKFYVDRPAVNSIQQIVVPSGLVQFLAKFGVNYVSSPEYTEEDIKNHIDNLPLPYKPYDYQETMVINGLLAKQQLMLAATSAGKSIVISMICSFLMSKGLKGLILVPSVSLTTQLHGDLLEYNLQDVYDKTRLIGGEHTEKTIDSQLTIATWQSMMKIKDKMADIDFIIIDESHGLKNDNESTDIVHNAIKAKYRLGLTGTLPEDAISRMSMFSCVGAPVRYIRTQDLINRGLATPVNINVIKLRYGKDDQSIFNGTKGYAQKLAYVKEHDNRNALIAKMSIRISALGNTVLMASHVQHGKDLFTMIMKEKYPDVLVENKDISGKNAFEFQKQHHVYFIMGSTEQKQRKAIIEILKGDSDAILVSNYSVFSTGISARGIANIMFVSPIKGYITVTQSIGRAIRLHVSKSVANIFDFVDDFSARGNSGQFVKQYEHRLTSSYEPEGFPLTERTILI